MWEDNSPWSEDVDFPAPKHSQKEKRLMAMGWAIDEMAPLVEVLRVGMGLKDARPIEASIHDILKAKTPILKKEVIREEWMSVLYTYKNLGKLYRQRRVACGKTLEQSIFKSDNLNTMHKGTGSQKIWDVCNYLRRTDVRNERGGLKSMGDMVAQIMKWIKK